MNYSKFNLNMKNKMGFKFKFLICKILFPVRNKFCLFNIFNKAKKNKVNLNYWNEAKNLGDTLTPVIVDYMQTLYKIPKNKKISKTKHLYAVGSVLTAGIQDCTVWGSGVLNATLLYRLKGRKIDVRAVRGPITRGILIDYGFEVPEVFGDPAILLPEIYMPSKIIKKYKFGIILHKDYILQKEVIDKMGKLNFKRINICTDDYKSFVNELLSVEIVISSSLHGIILAEAYGVSAILLKPQVDIIKYYDYYYSTCRVDFPIADNIYQAIDLKPIGLPDFSKLRDDLIKSFPNDIYN